MTTVVVNGSTVVAVDPSTVIVSSASTSISPRMGIKHDLIVPGSLPLGNIRLHVVLR